MNGIGQGYIGSGPSKRGFLQPMNSVTSIGSKCQPAYYEVHAWTKKANLRKIQVMDA
jgi:hypothetical protein